MTFTKPGPSENPTRDHILKFLSPGEAAAVSSGEASVLRRGDEYLDLEHLQRGVQRADGITPSPHALSRKAVQEDTWRRILRQLKAAAG